MRENTGKRNTDRDAVNAARKEWKDAQSYFENVRDPELIDYAAFGVEAARRKYMFLLKHSEGGLS